MKTKLFIGKEVWRPIPNYEGFYWFSNYQNVKNANGKMIAKVDCGNDNYKVKLQAQGQVDEKYLTTLTAEIFPECVEV